VNGLNKQLNDVCNFQSSEVYCQPTFCHGAPVFSLSRAGLAVVLCFYLPRKLQGNCSLVGIVQHGQYLSILKIRSLYIKHNVNSAVYLLYWVSSVIMVECKEFSLCTSVNQCIASVIAHIQRFLQGDFARLGMWWRWKIGQILFLVSLWIIYYKLTNRIYTKYTTPNLPLMCSWGTQMNSIRFWGQKVKDQRSRHYQIWSEITRWKMHLSGSAILVDCLLSKTSFISSSASVAKRTKIKHTYLWSWWYFACIFSFSG